MPVELKGRFKQRLVLSTACAGDSVQGCVQVCLCTLAWEGAASAGMRLRTRLLPWQALSLALIWWVLVKTQTLKLFFAFLPSDMSTDKLHSSSQKDLLHTDTLQPDRARCGDLHPGNHQGLPAEKVWHKLPSLPAEQRWEQGRISHTSHIPSACRGGSAVRV